METFFDRARKEGVQIGAATLVLGQLRRQLGRIDKATQAHIRTLSAVSLRQLGVALLGFRTHADLADWLRRRRIPKAAKK